MKIIGMWWNPEKAGEGFIFAFQDGQIVGYYYTYNGTAPVWYILYEIKPVSGTGGLVGSVGLTKGERTSEPGKPGKVMENRVGTCKIIRGPGDTYIIEVNIDDRRIRYQIGSLFGTGLPIWNPQPEPGPDPEPPPPAPITKIVQWDQLLPTAYVDIGGDPFLNKPDHNPNVMYGSVPTDIDDINPRTTWKRYQLTVLPNAPAIHITAVNGSDDPRNNYNAQVVGIRRGDTLHPGNVVIVDLKLGPGAPPASGWVQSSFFIDSDHGVLMNVSAQVADR